MANKQIINRLDRLEQDLHPANPPWGYGVLDRMTDQKNDLVKIGDDEFITEAEFKARYPDAMLVIFGGEKQTAEEGGNGD